MAQEITSPTSETNPSSQGTVHANPVQSTDPLIAPVDPQVRINQPGSGSQWLHLLRLLFWFLGISVGLIVIGSLIQDIPQLSNAIRWLIYRRGYPYFQAITLSALVVTASVVVPSALDQIVSIDDVHSIIRIVLKFLLKISSGYRSNAFWTALLFVSLLSFIVSLGFPRCLLQQDVLVSFELVEGGSLVREVFPGETISYAPSRYTEIEAKLEANLFNLPPPRINCEWVTSTGDGRLIQGTNCKINYQTGSDERSDPLSVRITQSGCAAPVGYYSFFLSTSE